jgi:hypothetical protein
LTGEVARVVEIEPPRKGRGAAEQVAELAQIAADELGLRRLHRADREVNPFSAEVPRLAREIGFDELATFTA